MAAPLLPIQRALRALADPERAKVNAGYFKTGPGEYGEGDVFLGVSVPDTRRVAREHRALPFSDVARLLASEVHEDRLLGLLVLVEQAERDRGARVDEVARFYLEHLDRVDNWDLVDSSAPQILGPYLAARPRTLLDDLAGSERVWRRRVAMLATQHFIRQGEVDDALRIATRLVRDPHDLIHKAVGWMLREVGKARPEALRAFLERHAASMPRTMLRYAIERLLPEERRAWMAARPRA